MDMFQLQGIDHVVLRSSDPQSLIAFYCEALGCRIEREVNQIGLTQLRAGASLIDIIRADTAGMQADQRGHNLDHFCLRVNPFDAARLQAHFANFGVELREARRVYGAEGFGPSVYLQDPDGNTVELKGPATEGTA